MMLETITDGGHADGVAPKPFSGRQEYLVNIITRHA